MRMSDEQVVKTRNDAKKISSFGKRWKPGETHITGYPIFWEGGEPKLLVAATWGNDIDCKVIKGKGIFWRTRSEVIDGLPTVGDIAYQASRIMKLLIKGAYNLECSKIEQSKISSSDKKSAIADIDKRYEVKDGKVGRKGAIGPLKYICTTEILDVPTNPADGSPIGKDARVVSQDLSDNKIRKIKNLLTDKRYRPEENETIFWVQWAFGTEAEKAQAGDVTPTGFTPEYDWRKSYPEEYEKIRSEMESMPKESDQIFKRNTVFKFGDEKSLMSSIQTYWVLNEENLAGLTEEDDLTRLKKVARTIRSLKVPVTNPMLMEEISKIEDEEAAAEAAGGISTDPYVKDVAPRMEDLIEKEDIETAIRESGTDEDLSSKMNDELEGLGKLANEDD